MKKQNQSEAKTETLVLDEHWLLLRGLARESRHWGQFPEELAASLKKDGVNALVDGLDLPGTGRYSEMRSPLTIAGITDFAREKHQEIRNRQRDRGEAPAKRTYLVAVSLGGMVASSWLERWPKDFSGVVLVNTSFRGYSPIHHRLRLPSYRSFLDIIRGKDELAREREVLKMVSNRPELYENTAEVWARIQQSRPVSVENFGRQLLAAARFESKISAPPAPVLVLNSLGDRMVHPACSEQIADRWHADLRTHETAGHELPLDDGPWVIDQIRRWRKKITRD